MKYCVAISIMMMLLCLAAAKPAATESLNDKNILVASLANRLEPAAPGGGGRFWRSRDLQRAEIKCKEGGLSVSVADFAAAVAEKEKERKEREERQRLEEEARKAETRRLEFERKLQRLQTLQDEIEAYKKFVDTPSGRQHKDQAWGILADNFPEFVQGLQDGDVYGLIENRAAAWKSLAKNYPERRDEIPLSAKQNFQNSLGMTFVLIPAGSFWMGSPEDEPGRDDDERRHRVTLSRDFFMQTTEATQGQWKAVMGDNPSRFKDCGDDCPVEMVSWNDVQEFIKKLNRREDKQYRLPTEAEWERAARAETTTPFFYGECLSTDQANYDGNYPMDGCAKGRYRKKTLPVGGLNAPNAWGLHDMHGNVREWCRDWYGEYPSGNVTDSAGPSLGHKRVYRGGSWGSMARFCRSAYRNRDTADFHSNHLGFRLVLPTSQD